jgi:putative ABC transport system ATP-binding protein
MSEAPIIEISGLRKVYRVGRVDVEALRGVDLDVGRGEFVSIVGPSGSGKSTLFHIVGGLTPATSGVVRISGQEVGAMSDGERTRLRKTTVSFVFQKFNLLPNLTAGDNIALARFLAGKNHGPDPQFQDALKLLGIADRLRHKPSELSGGEQQRVAIARALVHAPRFIIADEPTGNLDPATAWEIMQLFLRINARGATVVMATHNREIVDLLRRRVIAIDAGQIARDDRSGRYHDDFAKSEVRA